MVGGSCIVSVIAASQVAVALECSRDAMQDAISRRASRAKSAKARTTTCPTVFTYADPGSYTVQYCNVSPKGE